jgi:hypothetical protein
VFTTLSGSLLQLTNTAPLISGNTFEGMSTGVSINNTNPDFINLAILDNTFACVSTGIILDGNVNATVSGNQFAESIQAVRVSGSEPAPLIDNNTFVRNDRSVVFQDDDALFSASSTTLTDSTFIGGAADNRVGFPTTIAQSGVVPEMPIAYKSTNSMIITSGVELLVPAGITLSFNASQQVNVNAGGRLVANGSDEYPAVFTGLPGQGAWNGFSIAGEAEFDHCVIEFANTAMTVSTGNANLDRCRVSDSNIGINLNNATGVLDFSNSSLVFNNSDGIRRSNGSVNLESNSIFNNGGLGINNTNPNVDIMAEYTYWGDDTGPFDDSDDTGSGGWHNPDGDGQRVSDYVDYDPWAVAAPSQQGTITITAGDGQTGPVGGTLPIPLEVLVESLLENPIEDVEVIFTVVSGDASIIETQPVLTNASGLASSQVQLGLTPGPVEIAVTARDINSPLATFGAEGTNGLSIINQAIEWVVVPGESGQVGDVNGDGQVNNHDAALVMALDAGELDEYSTVIAHYDSADVNAEGNVDSGDAMLLHAVQVGLIGQQSSSVKYPPQGRQTAVSIKSAEGTPQVLAQLPSHELFAGDMLEIPINIVSEDMEIVSYAVELKFDSGLVRLDSVLPGMTPMFNDQMMYRRKGSRSVLITGSASSFGAHQKILNVANLRFELTSDSNKPAFELFQTGPVVRKKGFAEVDAIHAVVGEMDLYNVLFDGDFE